MKNLRPAIVLTLFYIVVTGVAFPMLITGLAQVLFPHQANGSMLKVEGRVVGSELIGQRFDTPQYFHPRPSAAGSGYDANNSGGTNLGPTNSKLIEGSEGFPGIKQLATAYRIENGLTADSTLPADAVTRSASGLDPHISPANALLQAARVARARGMEVSRIKNLVQLHLEQPTLGIIGEPRVNVLKLNLALDSMR